MKPSAAGRTRLVVAGVASAGLIASAVTAIAPASAAGLNLLPSETTIAASASTDGSALILTSTVKVLNLHGLGVTPSATVTFTNNHNDVLGSGAIGLGCLLKLCTVTISVPVDSLEYQDNIITASFPGDLVAKASSASTEVVTQLCEEEVECSTENVTSPDGNTSASVESDSDSGYILLYAGGPALPCSVGGGATVINVSGSGLDADKEIFIQYGGAASDAYTAALEATEDDSSGHSGYMCYSSPNPWIGFSSASGSYNRTSADFANLGTVPQVGGQYVGLLADCGYLDDIHSITITAPCLNSQTSDGSVSTDIEAPPSDPHAGG